MIWESYPWRRALLKIADRIEVRKEQRRWSEASFARLELDVMLAAYTMRKLVEARTKVPDSAADSRVPVTVYSLHDAADVPDLMNWHHLERFFDLEQGDESFLSLLDVCNLLVHSWIFAPILDRNGRGLKGLLTTSDRKRSKGLFGIDVDPLLAIMRLVGSTPVAHLDMKRDSDGQWLVVQALSRDEARATAGPPTPPEGAGPGVLITIEPVKH